ncbi:hypothetical protein [Lignipirellula cremea]|uniref:Uncharacterized protein n=1 Tax=Lignipirellula cremea TaxID=2528010 RepID=A0A518DN08_9BACT|nr:hypothetical protein [Lignipirellula cremea]QDU93212.1 hypothetical protein Pla8534_09910 [Lignipirellula cremea]
MWNLSADLAHWKSADLALTIDLKRPEHGLQSLAINGDPIDACLLQIIPPGRSESRPETVIDAYPRGRDLVATYAQTPQRTVRPQAYWSPGSDAGFCSIEITLSMQSSLLQSTPQTEVCSRFSADCGPTQLLDLGGQSVERPGPNVAFVRQISELHRYAQFALPADYAGAAIDDASGSIWRHRFFPDSLEKGVIRRCRLLGVLFTVKTPLNQLTEHLQAWVAAPPRLAT